MRSDSMNRVEQLVNEGAVIPNPESVLIGDEVDLDRIAGSGVVIYGGCKIFGQKTLIMPGVKLGYEGPVTVEDCQIGPKVELKGGFFRGSAFLEKANMGSGAQVRDGCILEEEANGAHAVGLKQTILFPFVTLGSLINFCDCFMAGGTSRENHSEVGSSYIHFNYTPNQDKATPSLIGDVPRGVMMNQPPVFLGGQGGLVGPVRIEYGTVVAAGVVYRQDVLDRGKLLVNNEPFEREVSFHPGLYWQVEKPVINNTNYIANLIALRHWYLEVRSQFFQGGEMRRMLFEGVVEKLDAAIKERIRRFKALSEKMPESAEKYRSIMKGEANEMLLNQKKALHEQWPALEGIFAQNLDDSGGPSSREPFIEEFEKRISENRTDYIATIQGLDKTCSEMGTAWLQGIVDRINGAVLEVMPSFRSE
ncbi:MAG: UDP-N-acetylglucosamine pyrophosphorylase [Deltaproteobacteria bacterium]|nr:UDP-N-acetylglucosamine pyrophosphorylase [Deltaproteobacteria bacterium]